MQTPDQVEEHEGRDLHGSGGARPVAGIVLAAGSSSRMGRNKMLLPLDGSSVLRGAVDEALAAGLEPVVVVLGHEQDEARETLLGAPCEPVYNPDYEEGIHTSARVGVESVPEKCAAAVIMLADMPFVTAEMLRGLVERYRATGALLVISEYGGEINAPPMLYDRSLFDELRVMKRRCGREVVERHRDEAEVVEWSREALDDLDHPEDYERIRAELEPSR